MTQPVGPRASCAGPLRVQEQYILFARRRGHQKRPARVPQVSCRSHATPRTLLISCDAGSQTAPVRKRCGPIVWRGSTRVHARPRRSEKEGLDSRGKFFVGSTPQAIMRRGATRVLRGSRGSHTGPAGPSRVHFTLRGSHTPFGLLKFY